MQDISARELKGHKILAVERFHDNTRWMIEFSVLTPDTPYGEAGEEIRTLLASDCPFLPQKEPLYTLVNINPSNFSTQIKEGRLCTL